MAIWKDPVTGWELNLRGAKPENNLDLAAYRQAHATEGVGPMASPRADAFFGVLAERFEILNAVLGELESTLGNTRERILGSWPENVQGAETRQAPTGMADAALRALSEITERAHRALEHAITLNGGL